MLIQAKFTMLRHTRDKVFEFCNEAMAANQTDASVLYHVRDILIFVGIIVSSSSS
jgi:hypothetical protein